MHCWTQCRCTGEGRERCCSRGRECGGGGEPDGLIIGGDARPLVFQYFMSTNICSDGAQVGASSQDVQRALEKLATTSAAVAAVQSFVVQVLQV